MQLPLESFEPTGTEESSVRSKHCPLYAKNICSNYKVATVATEIDMNAEQTNNSFGFALLKLLRRETNF